MSDTIKHECGIAFVRLLKPLDFYLKKYGTPFYGLNKMQILMEKQHNRGQDGAGLANIKLFPKPGHVYINRIRSNDDTPIKEIFQRIYDRIEHAVAADPSRLNNPAWLKEHVEFTGEVFLGHLRYGTFGKNDIENVHPVSRENNWMTRSLVLAGNFNLTNIDELYERLIDLGQYPPAKTDTVTILERIGHFLDRENEDKYRYFKDKGYSKREITDLLARHIDLKEILSLAARRWDGGYVMAGMIGHGDAFVMRDPCGIRPAYYYRDDEVVVVRYDYKGDFSISRISSIKDDKNDDYVAVLDSNVLTGICIVEQDNENDGGSSSGDTGSFEYDVTVSKGGVASVEISDFEWPEGCTSAEISFNLVDSDGVYVAEDTITLEYPATSGTVRISNTGYTNTDRLSIDDVTIDYVEIAKVEVVDAKDGVTLAKDPKADDVLRANITLSDGTVIYTYPADSRFSYEWILGDDQVVGTESSYTVTSENVGKQLKASVTIKDQETSVTYDCGTIAQ